MITNPALERYIEAMRRITEGGNQMHPGGIEGAFRDQINTMLWINRLVGFIVGAVLGLLVGAWLW
jgi:uncharacterized membrane protein